MCGSTLRSVSAALASKQPVLPENKPPSVVVSVAGLVLFLPLSFGAWLVVANCLAASRFIDALVMLGVAAFLSMLVYLLVRALVMTSRAAAARGRDLRVEQRDER